MDLALYTLPAIQALQADAILQYDGSDFIDADGDRIASSKVPSVRISSNLLRKEIILSGSIQS